jgi:hypothetical protein
MAPTDHAPFGAPTVWVVTEEAFWKRTTSPRKTVRFAGEKAKFETVTTGPRTAVAVADGTRVAEAVAVSVAVAVLEAVAVADGWPVAVTVGETTGVFDAVGVGVAVGTGVDDAVIEAVAVGTGVTVASRTMIVPVMVGYCADRYA